MPLISGRSTPRISSFSARPLAIAPPNHAQHRFGVGADVRHRVRYARFHAVVVRVESPDRPLLDVPIQSREADSLGAGGRLLDHCAQAMPSWFAGHKYCRSSRCLVDLVCHKAPPEKEEKLQTGMA